MPDDAADPTMSPERDEPGSPEESLEEDARVDLEEDVAELDESPPSADS